MKLDGDSIQFEFRTEVISISQALEEWKEKNPKSDLKDEVQTLIDLLGVLDMTW